VTYLPRSPDHDSATEERASLSAVGIDNPYDLHARSRFQEPPLSAKLRARTGYLHEQTETLLGLPDAVQTLEDYRSCLCRFFGLYLPLEHLLAAFGEWESLGLALPSPSHSTCLAADLAALGIDPACVACAPPALLPHLPNFAHAVGALYVLEGATLGGRVILRSLEARIGPRIAGATKFFDGRAEAAGPLWQRFKAALDAFGNDWPQFGDDVLLGAESVFRAILTWFSSDQVAERPA
jgi:heme oxygenase (biliverdin-IX-beta and delta-forming)